MESNVCRIVRPLASHNLRPKADGMAMAVLRGRIRFDLLRSTPWCSDDLHVLHSTERTSQVGGRSAPRVP